MFKIRNKIIKNQFLDDLLKRILKNNSKILNKLKKKTKNK